MKNHKEKKIKFIDKIRDYSISHSHSPPPSLEEYKMEIKMLKKQANKRHGTLHKSIFASRSFIIFSYHNIDVKVGFRLVEVRDEEFRHETCVKVKFNLTTDSKLRIYLKDISFFESFELGMKKFEIGPVVFNNKFIVKGNEESFAINFLKKDVIDKLLYLEGKFFYPIIKINKKELQVIAQNRLYGEEEYDELINFTITLLDRLRLLGHIKY